MTGGRRTCAFHTLGCKVNQYDTEGLMRLFRERGYEVVDFDSPADVYCINTCTVTQMSDKKSRQAVRRARRANPSAVVAVVGCYAQAAPAEVAAIPGVDVVLGTRGRRALVDAVERAMRGEGRVIAVSEPAAAREFEELPVDGFPGRIRAFVKVQDGCDDRCSYCKVPYVRGRSRSREPERVLFEVERLVDAGYREIVLTGVHLGAYGLDLPGPGRGRRPDLAWLVRRVHEIETLGRLRLSSVEPLDVSEDLIEAVAGLERVAKHLHIPLQSGDDTVLAAMNRRYRAADYERLVERIRGAVSPVGITTDIMVGFPGETDDMFERSLEFAARIGFSRMHVFRYSRRPGTPAGRAPAQVDPEDMRVRSERMLELSRELSRRFHESLVGRGEQVLVEEIDDSRGVSSGFGTTYVRIELPAAQGSVGQLVPVAVVEAGCDAVAAQRVAPRQAGFGRGN